MFTTVSSQLNTNTLLRLINYLQAQGEDGDVSAAINAAVEYWLDVHDDVHDGDHDGVDDDDVDHYGRPGCAKQSACAHTRDAVRDATEAAFPRGYQWKSLFLPEGTVLRSWSYGEHNYARVEGDRIMHQGRAVSPNQFARLFARTTRNAWFDLSVRFPGEKHYRMAGLLRKELAAQQQHEREWEREREREHEASAAPATTAASTSAASTSAASTSAAAAPAAATPAAATPTIATAAADLAPTTAFPAELVPTLAAAIAQALVVSRYEAVPRSEAVQKSDFDGGWDLPERRKFRHRAEDIAF